MARLLLGVSGGIAAYKALETVAAGDQGRPRGPRDPDADEPAVRRRGHRLRGSPARRCCPASSSPTRRGAPIPVSRAGAGADQPPGAGRARGPVPHRPGERQHDREARARPRRQPPDDRRARGGLSGGRRAGDEQPHVPPRRDAGEPRRSSRTGASTVIAPGRGRAGLARRARGRPARRARASCSRPCEALLTPATLDGRPGAGHRRRHPRADRQCALHRQPILGADGLCARGSGRPPRRRGDGGGRQRRARAARRRQLVTVETAAELAGACDASASMDCDVLLMAAAVADFRPRRPAADQAQEGLGRRRRSSSRRRQTCSALWLRGGAPGRCCRLRRRARGATPSTTGAASSSASGWTRSSSTTYRSPGSDSTRATTR